ncbi:TetR/AcrR family transcriptional regulator [Rathayibacter sp. KR2-224]|uniref:TetR/AcrR family transcriptional regulator n=1 Tax=Rathayibacter sp. KR2-224 TaxID=3400913 RepID=UPI003C0C177A
MPAPTRTTNAEILAAALRLVEEGGPDALTMKAVASGVGVQPPSLYKRVQSREHLLGLVVEQVANQVAAVLDDALSAAGPDPVQGLVALARALRGFAGEHPRLFGVLFAQVPEAARPSQEALARASSAVLTAAERLAGPDRALDAARTVTAWAYGYLTMEFAGAFQLGGSPSDAFEFGAVAIARSLGQAGSPPSS